MDVGRHGSVIHRSLRGRAPPAPWHIFDPVHKGPLRDQRSGPEGHSIFTAPRARILSTFPAVVAGPMKIVGFNKTSLLDWDGHVVAVIYLPDCNMRCHYCHNRDLVLDPKVFDEVPLSEVEEFVKENLEFLDGVVITGGEPTIHSDLPDLVRHIKDLGVKVKLDTNGTNPEMLGDLIDSGLLDYVAMDIKAPLNDRYEDVCGVPVNIEMIKRSIEVLERSNIDHEFRVTVVPILLTSGDIESIAAYIGGAKKLAIQQFHPKNTLDPNFAVVKPYDPGTIKAMAENAKRYVKKVVIRGDI